MAHTGTEKGAEVLSTRTQVQVYPTWVQVCCTEIWGAGGFALPWRQLLHPPFLPEDPSCLGSPSALRWAGRGGRAGLSAGSQAVLPRLSPSLEALTLRPCPQLTPYRQAAREAAERLTKSA